jgi:hypothetical protein
MQEKRSSDINSCEVLTYYSDVKGTELLKKMNRQHIGLQKKVNRDIFIVL